MREMHLKSTRTYSIFNKVIGNRNLDPKNLKRIKESINEIGLQMPILVNQNKSIIDGQHRLQAAKELEIPITYIVSKDSCEQNIDQLQISKKWTALDFCNRNALRGNKDCQRALKIAEEWFIETNGKFSRINILALLDKGYNLGGVIKCLRNNIYEININNAIRIYNALKILSLNNNPKFNSYSATNSRVLKRMNRSTNGLDLNVIEKITKKNYLICYTNANDQYNYLMDLYNKYNKKK